MRDARRGPKGQHSRDMWLRKIVFPAKITLEYKAMRGIGVREVILLGAAALQAVYFIFLAQGMSVPLRLTLAVALALALIIVATVPVRGYRFEQFALLMVRGLLRPKIYLHQTARRADEDTDQRPVYQPPPRREIRPTPAPAAAAEWQGDWAGPNVALVLVVFLLILGVASVAAWMISGGELPWGGPAQGGW